MLFFIRRFEAVLGLVGPVLSCPVLSTVGHWPIEARGECGCGLATAGSITGIVAGVVGIASTIMVVTVLRPGLQHPQQ